MREYALVFAVAAAVTYLLTPLARRLAVAVGAMATPRDRDVHTIPTPRLGGLAMYAGLAAALLVATRLPLVSKIFREHSEPRAVLLAGGVIVVVGALDDRYGLDALTKLAGQVLAAGVMVLSGVQLLVVPFPSQGSLSLGGYGVPLTVLLTVLLVNAVNFVDGLDGLAAGVTAIAALALFLYTYHLSVAYHQERAGPATLLAAVLAGVCVGFLPHNFSPARLFMGDSGSMLLGLCLAAATASVTGTINFGGLRNEERVSLFVPVLVPVAVLAVPFVDLVLAVVRRTRARRAPWAPDKRHLHHRLLEIGHSHTRAVLIMYFWSALLGFGGVAVGLFDPATVAVSVGLLALAALLASAVPRLRPGRH